MAANPLNRIMVAADSREGMQAALGKAARLCEGRGAGLSVVQTFYDRVAEEPAEVLPADERERLVAAMTDSEQKALETLVAPLRGRIDGIDARTIWAKDAGAAIVEAAARWRAQLLIKPAAEHHAVADFLQSFLRQPVDWTLMRQAPCPVLVSTAAEWSTTGSLLAAVDVADGAHDSLNREILRRAGQLAAVIGARVHVVTVYPDLGQTVNQLQVATDYAGIKADMRENRHRRLNELLGGIDLEPAGIHLLEGRPERVIPALAAHLRATLTVLGTAARHGVGKLFIGNTAEDLIGRLPGDLMTVRAPWS